MFGFVVFNRHNDSIKVTNLNEKDYYYFSQQWYAAPKRTTAGSLKIYETGYASISPAKAGPSATRM